MFSRKRHFYQKSTFYAAVLTAFSMALALSFWMGGDPRLMDEVTEGKDQEKNPAVIQQDQQVSSQQVQTNIGQAGITGEKVIGPVQKQGFFVVEEDRYIRIYHVGPDGTRTLVRTADILFDLLAQEDQALFQNGVFLENEEQLMELLQDFES